MLQDQHTYLLTAKINNKLLKNHRKGRIIWLNCNGMASSVSHLHVCFSRSYDVTNLPHLGTCYSTNHKDDEQGLVTRAWLAHGTK